MQCRWCKQETVRQVLVKQGTSIVRCSGCSLVSSGYEPDASAMRDWYAQYYGERNTSRMCNDLTRARYVELLAGFEPYRKTGKLIDIGCGFGFFLSVAHAAGWEVYGTEIAESAWTYFDRLGLPGGRIFKGDVAEADFPAASFDAATLIEVIEHVQDPARVLENIAELVRPGGLLYLTTPNFNSLTRRLIGSSWSVIHPQEHLSYFTPKTLYRMLVKAGFRVRALRTTGWSYWEVFDRIRGRADADASFDACQGAREEFERGTLGALKRSANAVLSATQLGDTIKILAERV